MRHPLNFFPPTLSPPFWWKISKSANQLDPIIQNLQNSEMWKALRPFIDLISPPLCLVCEKPTHEIVCDNCRKEIDKTFEIRENFCLKCGGVFDGRACPRCRDTKFAFEFNRSVYIYQGQVKTIIEDFKYRGIKRVADYIAEKMSDLIDREYPQIDFLIPIPIHPTRERERGFSQTRLMVEKLSGTTGIPCDCISLKRVKHTRVQANLSKDERKENLKGAFELKNVEKFKGRSVLLVDDVMTTGTTMNEAAKLFRKFRSIRVYTITFAIAVYGSRF